MDPNFKEKFVNEGLDKMAKCLRKSLPLKILVNTDKKSLYYFNQNLLTPAEFLNSLELHVSPLPATRLGTTSAGVYSETGPILTKRKNRWMRSSDWRSSRGSACISAK